MELKQFKSAILPLRDKLVGYAQKLTEDSSDAEDVVQETMLKLWNIRDNLGKYHSIEALAMTIRSNLSRARKKVREMYLQTIQERKRRNEP